jgi:hypothetical protein
LLIVVLASLPRTTILQAHLPHQPRDRAAGDGHVIPAMPPDLTHAVDPEVRLEHRTALRPQLAVLLRARRRLAQDLVRVE